MTTLTRYAGRMAHQMLNMLWLLLAVTSICSPFFSVPVQASWNYSSNPADYDFGWFAIGASPGDLEPHCTYCLNGLTDDTRYNRTPADNAIGRYWNITVGSYRCDGVETNELWAYHEPTQSILFGNFTQVLCIDAASWNSLGILKLRQCNSSAISQQWRRNDSRLISALSGPQGEELFMVGVVPDKNTNPTNQVFEKYILLGSSIPSNSDPGFSYSSDFIYLSSNNLIDRSTDRFTTQGLLDITYSSLDNIVNGGFERSTIQAGPDITWNDWNQLSPSYFALCGWVIDYGPIDYVKSGLLAPAEGSYSVHLNTHSDTDHWGQVSQTIRTEAGSQYLLSFYFNGFPPQLHIDSRPTWQCSPTYHEALLLVRVTNASTTEIISAGAPTDGTGFQQNFSINVLNSNSLNIGSLWQLRVIKFKALTNVSTIAFRSLNFNNSCGPMIDNITLERLKAKSFWQTTTFKIVVGSVAGLVLIAAILLGIVVGRRKYFVPEEDYSDLYKTENARIFSMKELSASTKKFSSVLGEGAFGTVYKADFPDGTMGAVKVEKPKQMHLSEKVLASEEIAVLLRVHHRNLVNLTGFCINQGRHMLVFEYLPNGSLYDRLHQSVIPDPPGDIMDSIILRQLYANVLPWRTRIKIASDIAYGLEYLHHDADPPIVHRDVKSRNILLTATDSAKLSDFGLSKSAPVNATTFQSIETMVRGSIGYLDPQYFLTGVFSAKSDVFSYGVVLLELISGHQAIYNAASLTAWAAPYLVNSTLYPELVDKKLDGNFEPEELESVVELSKMCTQEDSRMRPNMRQVVAFLNARNLIVAGGESSEQVEQSETMVSREEYHKMHPLFIDFEALPSHSGSGDNIFVTSPQPRG